MNTKPFLQTVLACALAFPLAPALADDAKAPPSVPPVKAVKDAAAVVRAAFVPPKTEAAFIQNAVKSGTAEVKLATLALTKAQEEKVKTFAQLIVTEHAPVVDALKTMAEGMGIPVEVTDPDAKQRLDDLDKKSGKEFDEAFLEEASTFHARDIALFEAGKKVATSTEVSAFIDKHLPVIQRRAEKINLMAPGANRSDGGGTPPKPVEEPPGQGRKPLP
jgi:putative membrane protein